MEPVLSTATGDFFCESQSIPANKVPLVDVSMVLDKIPANYRRWVVAGVWDFIGHSREIDWVTDINGHLNRGNWKAAVGDWMKEQAERQGYPTPYIAIGNLLWASMQVHGVPDGAPKRLSDWAADIGI